MILIKEVTKEDCYNAGYDCGTNGANTDNCNFSYFATKEKLKSWERGKADAEKYKNSKQQT